MVVALDPSTELKRVMTLIARNIVDDPEQVFVDSEAFADETVIRLRVAPRDLPVIMEDDESVGRSLKNLLAEMSLKYNQQFALKIAATDPL